MRAVLLDAYRSEDKIVIWLRTPEENIRLEKDFTVDVYMEACELAKSILNKHKIGYRIKTKLNYLKERKTVFEVTIRRLSRFENIIKQIEKEAHHRLVMYNADIAPEQMFLYKNDLRPFSLVEVTEDNIISLDELYVPMLEKAEINLINAETIMFNNELICGKEEDVLREFAKKFISKDPDVILMDNAFSNLPYLVERLNLYNIECPFHRRDQRAIKHKGGKTFFSYGRAMYRDYAIRLNSRFLLDSCSVVGTECDIDAIIELSYLSGNRFQQIASRSFGAVFQSALTRELVRRDYLVPFKEKPVDMPISMFNLIKADRVGHVFDSITGFHTDVAEIDFSSLFPWIIYNYNISTETLLKGEPPYQDVPNLPFKISLREKGIIPCAIKPLLDRRMEYKKNPAAKARAQGLKWVLVTSYGYLRFREFKLGLATSHMAIGAFAREILLKTKELCEEKGYRIMHGITDSLYIQKKGINERDIRELCREIELEIGVPISYEGIFRWIVFLPSVNDNARPVATHYYGLFEHGEIKVRGIETRQRGVSKIIKYYQNQVFDIMAKFRTKEEITNSFPVFCSLLRELVNVLHYLKPEALSSFVVVSKTDYKNNIPQKIVLEQLKKKSIKIVAGQKVSYIFSTKGAVLPEDYKHNPDIMRYRRLLVRSLFVIMQPFGFTKDDIYRMIKDERQTTLIEHCKTPLHTDAKDIQIPQASV